MTLGQDTDSGVMTKPGLTITAFPKTGQNYTMQCAPAMTDVWGEAERCVGVKATGHGLIV